RERALGGSEHDWLNGSLRGGQFNSCVLRQAAKVRDVGAESLASPALLVYQAQRHAGRARNRRRQSGRVDMRSRSLNEVFDEILGTCHEGTESPARLAKRSHQD